MDMDEDTGIPERIEYGAEILDREHLTDHPVELFARWFSAAVAAGVHEPNGFCLCTQDPQFGADGRIVLLKGYDDSGFIFFTNYNSTKGVQLAQESRATMVFWWHELRRQVRIAGRVEKVSAEQADEYFATRPRSSQLGAWASEQSRTVGSRQEILDRYARFEREFSDLVARPPHWGGYKLSPERIEFWQGRDSRLHDRFVYLKTAQGSWIAERLMP